VARYTIAECPEISISVRGRDSLTTRERALDKIMQLIDNDELPTELPEGLSSEQLIEVKESNEHIDSEIEEDVVVRAVRELNNLANLKIKLQELHQAAIKVRKDLDILFIDTPIELEPEQFKENIKSSFKILKDFAVVLINYKDAKNKAENARIVLDEALQLNNTQPKITSSTKS